MVSGDWGVRKGFVVVRARRGRSLIRRFGNWKTGRTEILSLRCQKKEASSSFFLAPMGEA